MRAVYAVAGGLVALASSSAAQQLPNDTDLRAAYCARLLSKQIEFANELAPVVAGLPESPGKRRVLAQQRGTEDRHRRLLAYLVPRLKRLDLAPLKAASEMADADMDANERLATEAGCLSKDFAAAADCQATVLATSPARKKQSQCDDLAWLPF